MRETNATGLRLHCAENLNAAVSGKATRIVRNSGTPAGLLVPPSFEKKLNALAGESGLVDLSAAADLLTAWRSAGGLGEDGER